MVNTSSVATLGLCFERLPRRADSYAARAAVHPPVGTGSALFRNDVLMHKGLDDRTNSKQILQDAEKLAADAFGAPSSHW